MPADFTFKVKATSSFALKWKVFASGIMAGSVILGDTLIPKFAGRFTRKATEHLAHDFDRIGPEFIDHGRTLLF